MSLDSISSVLFAAHAVTIAIYLTAIGWIVRWTFKEKKLIEDSIKKINTKSEKLQYMEEILDRLLKDLFNRVRTHESIISRLPSGVDKTVIDRFKKYTNTNTFNLEKHLNELNMLSDDEDTRDSAFKQVAERYGNHKSLELMKKITKLYACNPEIYRHKKTLERRLEEIIERSRNLPERTFD